MKYSNVSILISLITAICCAIAFGQYAMSIFYCFIVIFTLSKPWVIRIYDLFATSMILDIYNGNFVGISFFQCLFLYALILRFRSILLNTRISYGIFYFGLALIVPELVGVFITLIARGSFVLLNHVKIIVIATVLFSIYCGTTIIHRKIRDA